MTRIHTLAGKSEAGSDGANYLQPGYRSDILVTFPQGRLVLPAGPGGARSPAIRTATPGTAAARAGPCRNCWPYPREGGHAVADGNPSELEVHRGRALSGQFAASPSGAGRPSQGRSDAVGAFCRASAAAPLSAADVDQLRDYELGAVPDQRRIVRSGRGQHPASSQYDRRLDSEIAGPSKLRSRTSSTFT